MPSANKRTRLTELEINFVSLCSKGANPGAKIKLKKEAEMPDDKTVKKDEKETKVDVKIDIESLAKAMSENLKKSLADIVKNKEMSSEAMADAVVAIVSGDLEKMQKSMQEQISKSLGEVQKELDAKIAKAKEETTKVEKGMDEALEMNGVSFKKSDIGETAFAAIKASYTEQQKLRKEMEHAKMVTRVEKEYPNVAGKPEDKADFLEVIEKSSDTVKAMGLALLKSLNEKGAFYKKELGGSDHRDPSVAKSLETDTDASMKLEKMAAEYATKHNISKAQAYDIISESPEGERLYEEHLAQQK